MCTAASPTTQYPASLARADALEGEITDLCAQINAASYRLLQLIAELDDQQPWGAWGLASCAHWLNWRCGIGLNAAREKVRAAHALKGLPVIASEFESGRLSFSKVRALTRIADSANEAELLELALHATAAQVEKLVRGYRRAGRLAEREQAMANHAARELNYYHDEDGCLVIRARLPAEEGAVVLQALEAAMEAQRPAEDEDASEDVTAVTSADENRFAQQRADALTTMAETTLRHGAEPLSSRYRGNAGRKRRRPLGTRMRAAPRTGHRPPHRLRRQLAANHRGCRRQSARHRPQNARGTAGHTARAALPRRRLPLSGVHPSPLRRCTSHPALGERGHNLARQPRVTVPPSPSPGARGRLRRGSQRLRRHSLYPARWAHRR
jgi:hypothetical protein